MTKKEKKIAQTVEKNIPKPKSDKGISTKQTKKAPVKSSIFDLSKVDPEQIKMVESMGLPIRKLAAWADKMEATQEAHSEAITMMAKAMPTEEGIKNAVSQSIENAQEKTKEAYVEAMKNQTDTQQGQGRGGMGEKMLMNFLMGGGGGGISEMDKMLIEYGRENMMLGREVIRQVFSRGAKDILDRVDENMKMWREKRKTN